MTLVAEVSKVGKGRLKKTGWKPQGGNNLVENVGRVFGSQISDLFAVKDSWFFHYQLENLAVKKTYLFRLRHARNLIAICLEIDAKSLEHHLELRKLSHKFWKNIESVTGLFISKDFTVDALCVTVKENANHFSHFVSDGWLALESQYQLEAFQKEVIVQIAVRCGIEKALLNRASQANSHPLLRMFDAPRAAFSIRRFPDQLLIDRNYIQLGIQALRESLNFRLVRENVIDRARSWWASFGILFPIFSFIFGLVAGGFSVEKT